MASNSFESELLAGDADHSAVAEQEDEPDVIYLDYNATTPVDPEVADVIMPFLFSHFGNPSSSYALGVHARTALEQARAQVAALINCASPDEVCFTSCATESINMALKGAALAARARDSARTHIVTVQTEHVAVLEVCRHLGTLGFTVIELPVDNDGVVSEAELVAAVDPARTACVVRSQCAIITCVSLCIRQSHTALRTFTFRVYLAASSPSCTPTTRRARCKTLRRCARPSSGARRWPCFTPTRRKRAAR